MIFSEILHDRLNIYDSHFHINLSIFRNNVAPKVAKIQTYSDYLCCKSTLCFILRTLKF